MTVTCTPDTEELPTKTLPQRRAGGWSIRPQPRIGLGLGSDDELLMVENRTVLSWLVYHDFHRLGIIDPEELLIFHLYKHGSLSVRPWNAGDEVEFLVIPLNFDITFVYIYRRLMAKDVEIFDMRPL